MVDPDLFTRFARLLAPHDGGLPLASGLCRACVQVLGARGGALTFAPVSVEQTTATTDDASTKRMEDLQEVLGEGPGLLAFGLGRVVSTVVGPQATSAALPVFSSAVGMLGLSATVVAVPARIGRHPLGALTLYQEVDDVPIRPDAAQPLADLSCAMLLASSTPLEQQWPDDSRRQRAIGMVIAQLRVTASDALAAMRARALARSCTLITVIDDVLGHRTSFDPSES
ncbi:hypothetical protein M1843_11410 [Isoptericola sp. 4D.3]|uniref:ANTAR domain-containing protein n=1 Tax=Isoptericola peretonis TaxID=2918523 RepID=A0ABT0J4C2_9MICO|nr:hypothetical protein [Isoptericola sp. 4D.3]